MDVRLWDSATDCISSAKAAGYHVVATQFDAQAVSIHEIDWTQPTAVVLGNERAGTFRTMVQSASFIAFVQVITGWRCLYLVYKKSWACAHPLGSAGG